MVQVVGEHDGWVDPDDSRDILAFPSGHEIGVRNANHRNLFRLDLAPNPDGRYAMLREAFVGQFRDDPSVESTVHRVIFILHGIRASNVEMWIRGLKARIKERDKTHTVVLHPDYGYFSAMRFALPGVRRRNIAIFQDWYTEALAKYPTAEFDIIAHSNGTYILGQSLKKTPGMRFKNVALAGSVLPTSFSWKDLKDNKQVDRVRNHRANRDYPVAILCNALRGLQMRDVGTAGFTGFVGGNEKEEVAYYPGGHGKALEPDYQDQLINFVFGGEPQEPEELLKLPGCFRQASNLTPYVAVLLFLLALGGLACIVFWGGEFHFDHFLLVSIGLLILYIILDII